MSPSGRKRRQPAKPTSGGAARRAGSRAAAANPSPGALSLPSARRPKVALLIETSNSYARGLLEGVNAYIREHRGWSIYLAEHNRGDRAPPWLEGWDGDGIIARVENEAIGRAVKACGLPLVDVSAARLIPGVPWVETDDREIARAAADHFIGRGFRHFAFCGDDRFNWSRWRCDHFRRFVTDAGYDCAVFAARDRGGAGRDECGGAGATSATSGGGGGGGGGGADDAGDDWEEQQRATVAWVASLPKPVGVFASYDIRGQQLLEACRRAGIGVPDEVAVLGVDNDRLLCDLADPPLSSVIPDAHRTGYEAAVLLDRMMRGEAVSAEGVLVKPIGVATRRSTDVLATDDQDLSAAVRFIREHAFERIGVKDLLDVVPMSRRRLESRFRRLLGRSPHDEIIRLRVERAKELLAESDLPLKAIAHRVGVRHVEYLSVMFRRTTGMTPTEYRTGTRRRVEVGAPAPRDA